MKRVLIATGILLAIISVSLGSLVYIHSTISRLEIQITEIEEEVLREDYQAAQAHTTELVTHWHQVEPILVRLVRHSAIDETTGDLAKLPYLLEYEHYGEFMSELSRAKMIILRIWEDEVPNLKNIL